MKTPSASSSTPRGNRTSSVAPNTVYAATITHGISTNTYHGAFGSQEAMRVAFRRALGVSPKGYRSRFCTTVAS